MHAQCLRSLLELLQRPGIGGRLRVVGIVQDREIVTRCDLFMCSPSAAREIFRGGLDREYLMLGRDVAGGDRVHTADTPVMAAALEFCAQQRGLQQVEKLAAELFMAARRVVAEVDVELE